MSEPVATFPAEVLDLMATTDEVDIETHAADGTTHRTIIWVVVTDGIAYIRSYRGATARCQRFPGRACRCRTSSNSRAWTQMPWKSW